MPDTPGRPVLLNVFVAGHGYHEAAWKIPAATSRGLPGLDHFAHVARIAERGPLDSLFLADAPGVAPFRARWMVQSMYDPIDLLAALAPLTSHIGLLATASTTYGTPWDVARRFATLDHLSGGRAGWNVVTTGTPWAAANFGDRPYPPHAERYARAREFVAAVRAVWDGWEDDAVVASLATGEWADPARLHPPAFRGEHVAVAGYLPLPRSPQGHPVLAQAGSSDDGIGLAARDADVVFTPQASPDAAAAFRARLLAAVAAEGRSPDDVRTLPGLSFVLGSTQAEADAANEELDGASSPEFRLANLGHIVGGDPARGAEVDPHGPVPLTAVERAGGAPFAAAVMRVAREGGLTYRQTAEHFARLPGGLHLTGTPEALADLIEAWWRGGAADGFTLQPLRLPLDLELFVDHVMPLLQARGVARREPGTGTLRDRWGLPRPPGHRTPRG